MTWMPRPQRIALGGYIYHVLNRANGRLRIFRKDTDFVAFEQILAEGVTRLSVRICGYCIMVNHWHLLLWPYEDGDLSDFMRWVTLTHTQRYHTSHGTVGIRHFHQGRYKSFPVQSDLHYLTVLRYIETNPMRAGLVKDAGQWPWYCLGLCGLVIGAGVATAFLFTPVFIAISTRWEVISITVWALAVAIQFIFISLTKRWGKAAAPTAAQTEISGQS